MHRLRNLRTALPLIIAVAVLDARAADGPLDYRVLATSRTSTMEQELNEAAAAGYRFSQATGGKSANGGQEVIVAMVREGTAAGQGVWKYKLLATTKTSTMQKEIQQLADEGYEYRDQAVFQSAFGGKEVVVIMELDPSAKDGRSSYRLLATSKTSTMQKELKEAGALGYALLRLSIGETAMGGNEIVAVLKKN